MIEMCDRDTIDKIWLKLTEEEQEEIMKYWGLCYNYAPVPVRVLKESEDKDE